MSIQDLWNFEEGSALFLCNEADTQRAMVYFAVWASLVALYPMLMKCMNRLRGIRSGDSAEAESCIDDRIPDGMEFRKSGSYSMDRVMRRISKKKSLEHFERLSAHTCAAKARAATATGVPGRFRRCLGWLFFYSAIYRLRINESYQILGADLNSVCANLSVVPVLVSGFLLGFSVIDWITMQFYGMLRMQEGIDLDNAAIELKKLLYQCGRAVACALFCFVALGIMTKDMGGIMGNLTLGVTAIIAFTAPEAVSDFFGLLVLLFDKPFEMGDHIRVAGVEGFVSEVNLRCFVIDGFDGSKTWVANKTAFRSNIQNFYFSKVTTDTLSFTLSYELPTPNATVFEELRSVLITWLRAVRVELDEDIPWIDVKLDLSSAGVLYKVSYLYPKGESLARKDPKWAFYEEARTFRAKVVGRIVEEVMSHGLKFATFPVSINETAAAKSNALYLNRDSL